MDVFKAPQPFPRKRTPTIFLAGSIEMGSATPWQEEIIKALSYQSGVLLNPRRDKWNPTWEQSVTNKKFSEQVTWELEGIEQSDLVVIYFDPSTKSPITLLELGLVIGIQKPTILSCPTGFWRKGNVDIIAKRNSIPVLPSLASLIQAVQDHLTPYRKES